MKKCRKRNSESALWRRFPMWDRWKELTIFWRSTENLRAIEAINLKSNKIEVIEISQIYSKFKCNKADYISYIDNNNILYLMLLASYVGLIEEHGRNLIQYSIESKDINPSHYGIKTSRQQHLTEEIGAFIKNSPIEHWGNKILELGNETWDSFDGKKAGVIRACVIRNLFSHGATHFDNSSINRLSNSGNKSTSWIVGSKIELNRDEFRELVSNLSSFARILSRICANL